MQKNTGQYLFATIVEDQKGHTPIKAGS